MVEWDSFVGDTQPHFFRAGRESDVAEDSFCPQDFLVPLDGVSVKPELFFKHETDERYRDAAEAWRRFFSTSRS